MTPKHTYRADNTYDWMHPVWDFTNIDRDGLFRFSTTRDDFIAEDILEKILNLSTLTWQEIKQETRGKNNRSKNHTLNYDGLSAEAKERVAIKIGETNRDKIFSIALQGKIRIIGLKLDQIFQVIWYDSLHRFYPVTK